MTVNFNHTKWGLAFNFEDRLCFLAHNDHYSNYLNKEFSVKVFYKIMYNAYHYDLDKTTKKIRKVFGFVIKDYKTKEEIINSSEYNLFQERGLLQIVPYCKIK